MVKSGVVVCFSAVGVVEEVQCIAPDSRVMRTLSDS